jgi:predicted nucleotidyltransferase
MLLLESKDFREFIALLNSRRVRFLIVGGHAVTFHGNPRFTADLDVWVATDPVNAARVEKAVKDFGFGRLFKAGDFSKPGYAVQLGRQPYRIDILTSVEAVDFATAYKRRKVLKAGGLALPFIGLDELLRNKRATGRRHDLDDAEKLEAGIRGRNSKSKTRFALPRNRKAGKRQRAGALQNAPRVA